MARRALPQPGTAVRGSRTGRPIMAALDLLGRRWALRALYELRGGALGFRALRARCDRVSSSVLRDRLRELLAAGLVEQRADSRYALSPIGVELGEALAPLLRWAARWARARQRGV